MARNRRHNDLFNATITSFLSCTLLFFFAILGLSHAEVTLDDSLGPSGPVGSGTLPDGTFTDYLITHDLGRLSNNNLFHSFGKFSIETGRSGTFTGPTGIENVIGRVTGGELSNIDGLLRCTIDGANLFLLNPAGVLFGPNATLDVKGAFHVSTADYVRFTDGTKFFADPAKNSVLSVASPEAFGFLGSNPSAITIDQCTLRVNPGETISAVGGDIKIAGGSLQAPSGRINLAGVDSAGEVVLNNPGQNPALNVDSFSNLGQIDIAQNALLSTSGDSGGTIIIRGGHFMVLDSDIFADTLGDSDGALTGIDIETTGDVVLTDRSYVTTDMTGAGDAGRIQVAAKNVEVSNGAVLGSRAWSGSSGDSGHVGISAETVRVAGSGRIESRTYSGSSGNAGQVGITADTLDVDGGTISARTSASGNAGKIDVQAKQVNVTNSGYILADAYYSSSTGRGGTVKIAADTLNVDDGLVQTVTAGKGDAGSIDVQVRQLTLRDGGQVSASARSGSSGHGGLLTVTATESVSISGAGSAGYDSGLYSNTEGSGNAGTIMLKAPNIQVGTDGSIETRTFSSNNGNAGQITIMGDNLVVDGGEVRARTAGAGNAGTIDVQAKQVTITNSGDILADTYYSSSTGRGGTVKIAADTLNVDDGLVQAVTRGKGDAGSIDLQVRDLSIIGGGQISTSAYSGSTGQGGKLTINAMDSVTISEEDRWGNNSGLFSSSSGSGDAGSIDIQAGRLALTGGAQVSTSAFSSSSGHGGTLTITATDSVTIAGEDSAGYSSGLFSNTYSSGDAGTIRVTAPTVTVGKDGQIESRTYSGSSGNGGVVSIMGDILNVDGGNILTRTADSGNAGSIDLNVRQLNVTNDAEILADTFFSTSTGDGGQVTILADTVNVDDARIGTMTRGEGKAGNIDLQVQKLFVTGGGQISTDSFGSSGQGGSLTITAADSVTVSGEEIWGYPSALLSTTIGSGDAGQISVFTPALHVIKGGVINTAAWGSGNAGDIILQVDQLKLDHGDISTATNSNSTGQGGTLTITASDKITLSAELEINNGVPIGYSRVLSSTAGSGDAGDIFINTPTLEVGEGGIIGAATYGAGGGGHIDLHLGRLLVTGGGEISSNGYSSKGGTVTVNASESVTISGYHPKMGEMAPQFATRAYSEISSEGRNQGAGGNVKISTPILTVENQGRISTSGEDNAPAGDIDINAQFMTLRDGGKTRSNTYGSGQAGKIAITTTETLAISGRDSGLYSETFGIGDGGQISVSASRLDLSDHASIEADTWAKGNAGSISVRVGQLTARNWSQISTDCLGGTGHGGTLTLQATESVHFYESSGLFSQGVGPNVGPGGDAGNILLYAPLLEIAGGSISTFCMGQSNAGFIDLQVDRVAVTDGGKISAGTSLGSSGKGGAITVTATDTVTIAGSDRDGNPSGLYCNTKGSGPGGGIQLQGKEVQLADRALISASSSAEGKAGSVSIVANNAFRSDNSSVTTSAMQAVGGDITIKANVVELINGTLISAESAGPGDAGNIQILADHTFVSRDSSVNTEARQADGGNIGVTTDYMVRLKNSTITSSVGGGPKTVGGNISIDPTYVILDNSKIVANAFEGRGGNIKIIAQVCLIDPLSLVAASSTRGIDGEVDIQAPITEINGTLAPLRKEFFSAVQLLREPCIARIREGKYSSFFISGRDGLPLEPGGLLPSPLY